MKGCRDEFQKNKDLFDATLKLEFAILQKLIFRDVAPAQLLLVSSFALHVDGQLYRYIRVIEDGDTMGLARAMTKKLQAVTSIMYILDYQYNKDTKQSSSRLTRTTKSDIEACLQLWETMCDASNRADPGLSCSSMLLVARNGNTVKRFFNFSQKLMDDCIVSVVKQPQHMNLCLEYLMTSTWHTNLSLEFQIDMINCLPPQWVHFPFADGPNRWYLYSYKEAILHDDYENIVLMQRQHAQMTFPKKRTPKLFHPTNHPRVSKSRQTNPMISLQQQFIHFGFLRVIDRSSSSTSIVWNAYDAESGVF